MSPLTMPSDGGPDPKEDVNSREAVNPEPLDRKEADRLLLRHDALPERIQEKQQRRRRQTEAPGTGGEEQQQRRELMIRSWNSCGMRISGSMSREIRFRANWM